MPNWLWKHHGQRKSHTVPANPEYGTLFLIYANLVKSAAFFWTVRMVQLTSDKLWYKSRSRSCAVGDFWVVALVVLHRRYYLRLLLLRSRFTWLVSKLQPISGRSCAIQRSAVWTIVLDVLVVLLLSKTWNVCNPPIKFKKSLQEKCKMKIPLLL